MALPLSITVIVWRPMSSIRHQRLGPCQESERTFGLMYAWIGPFVRRPHPPHRRLDFDKVGGSIVTSDFHRDGRRLGGHAGWIMMAYHSVNAGTVFLPVSWGLFVLFAASGIGSSSTFPPSPA